MRHTHPRLAHLQNARTEGQEERREITRVGAAAEAVELSRPALIVSAQAAAGLGMGSGTNGQCTQKK